MKTQFSNGLFIEQALEDLSGSGVEKIRPQHDRRHAANAEALVGFDPFDQVCTTSTGPETSSMQ